MYLSPELTIAELPIDCSVMYSQVEKNRYVSGNNYDILRTPPVSNRTTPEPSPVVGNSSSTQDLTDSHVPRTSDLYESLDILGRNITPNPAETGVAMDSGTSTAAGSNAGLGTSNQKMNLPRFACQGFLVLIGVVIALIIAVLVCTALVVVDMGKLRKSSDGPNRSNVMNAANVDVLSLGKNRESPAPSCAFILSAAPTSRSDMYWLKSSSSSQPVSLFCNMELFCGGILGGWMRLEKWDMKVSGTMCPPSLEPDVVKPMACRIPEEQPTCKSTTYTTKAPYSSVCGRVTGYIDATAYGFRYKNRSIDSEYVDGVSLTYGASPRKHIWTFAGGSADKCTNKHSFIEDDYFCEGVNECRRPGPQDDVCHGNPIWNSEGCRPSQSSSIWCNEQVGSPWFYKQLEEVAIDNIEMRLCRQLDREFGDITVQAVEIYVR